MNGAPGGGSGLCEAWSVGHPPVDEIVGEAFEDVGGCCGVTVGDECLGQFGHDGRSFSERGRTS